MAEHAVISHEAWLEARKSAKLDGVVIVDAPFAEGKEGVVGLFVVRAKDFEEAIEIAKTCPIVAAGGTVEVRKGEQVDG